MSRFILTILLFSSLSCWALPNPKLENITRQEEDLIQHQVPVGLIEGYPFKFSNKTEMKAAVFTQGRMVWVIRLTDKNMTLKNKPEVKKMRELLLYKGCQYIKDYHYKSVEGQFFSFDSKFLWVGTVHISECFY